MAMAPEAPKRVQALIVVGIGNESIDLFTCSNILSQFGINVLLAGAHMKCKVSGSIEVEVDYSIQQASEIKTWALIILLGGIKGVKELIANVDFLGLLQNHKGIIAAMGASATVLLQELGYVSEYGRTCWTNPNDFSVVERDGNIWTAPGVASAQQLAWELGKHFCGERVADNVAKNIAETQVVNTDGECDTVQETETKPQHEKVETRGPKTEEEAFKWYIWKPLVKRGWKKCSINGFKMFLPPSSHDDSGVCGTDWFISSSGVVKYLEAQGEQSLLESYQTAVQEQKQREPTPSPPKKKGRTVQYICPRHHEEHSKELFEDCLFEHIVWNRLDSLGWERWKRNGQSYYYKPPEGTLAMHSFEQVTEFLLQSDSDACFRIVDLYWSCQRIQKTMTTSCAFVPDCVERETKRRMPALAHY